MSPAHWLCHFLAENYESWFPLLQVAMVLPTAKGTEVQSTDLMGEDTRHGIRPGEGEMQELGRRGHQGQSCKVNTKNIGKQQKQLLVTPWHWTAPRLDTWVGT